MRGRGIFTTAQWKAFLIRSVGLEPEQLSERARDVILLRQFEELTFPEIAARLGRSEDACRMLFARAMTALTLKISEQP